MDEYAIIHNTENGSRLVMVSRDKGLSAETAACLSAHIDLHPRAYEVVPVGLPFVSYCWGYRRRYERALAELRQMGYEF